MYSLSIETNAHPFLRWTGSKNWLIQRGIDKYLPKSFNNYHEPFLGGGALFFYLDPKKNSFLSDLNEELINTYVQLRDNIDSVVWHLKKYSNTEQEYYRVRNFKCKLPETKAARFIYLNRTSFNGIYRVNSLGEYNVPYGRRTAVDLVTEDNLRAVSNALSRATIKHCDFYQSLKFIKKNDLVYLDPPYTVAHENNGFIEYNRKLFSWEDQEKLAVMIELIKSRGAYFILSNAEHKAIRALYRNSGKIFSISRYSKVGGRNKTRGMFNEVIITNTLCQ